MNVNHIGTYVGFKGLCGEKLVKVYLSKEQKHLLERIAKSLDIGESEVLITEKVHG